MPLTPFPVNEFGGLNLVVDPADLGTAAATTCSDLVLDRPGRFATRDGYAVKSTTLTAPSRPYIFATSTNVNYLTSSGTRLEAFGAAGAAIASVLATGTNPHSFVTYGTSAATVVYVTAALDTTVRKWDGAAWSAIAAAPVGRSVTHTLSSNRLVIAGHGNGHRVQFSDAGAPETWTSTSWVDVTPGDGEIIDQLIRWQNSVFAFKQTKFAVFTGESTLSDGSPVFNYRMFDGIGCLPGVGAACASPSGVYFAGVDGIYKTTGGAPVMISAPVRTLFDPFYRDTVGKFLTWYRGRLYVSIPSSGTVQTLLVYEEATNTWAQWSIYNGKTGGGLAASLDELVFVNGTDTKLYIIGPSWTTDGGAFGSNNGSAIPWAYQTGYSSAGGYFRQRIVSSGERKKHFKTDILGSGTVTHQILALNARPNDVADTGGSVTLGTSPAIARGSRRRGVRGTYFAHKLSGSGPAIVSGLTYWLSEISLDT